MKKTLAAVAVLGAFAGSALAADVTLYGIVDTGFAYQHTDFDKATVDNTDSFAMKSGQQSGSRFGLKGTEDLGNGLTVGFILENQFDSDTGALRNKDSFFHREASIFLQGGFGKIAFGRMGSINQGVSSWSKAGMLSAFGTSWDNSAQIGTVFHTGAMYDNMISYETPSFAGVKVYAQYSMGGNKYTVDEKDYTGDENESTSDRYYSIGATYNNGPVAAYLAVDSINYRTFGPGITNADNIDDSLTVTFGGSYDFEVVKVYLGAQYFDEVAGKTISTDSHKTGYSKGYGVVLSADAPVAGGKAMFGVGYYDASEADSAASDFDLTRWVVSAGYDYPLSKRTDVYAVATYLQEKYEDKATPANDVDPNTYSLMVGLRHKF
ncbi:MAG: porin [Sutterellaceae bacterium]|nr:porin [Sutterellaceae bacterium]